MSGSRAVVVLLVIVAVLLGIIAALGAVIVAMVGGADLSRVLGSGGAAFVATVTLALLIEVALGLLSD